AEAPSSTRPLQSLSSPSQISALAAVVWWHDSAPLEQTMVPAAHTPDLPVEHATPVPGTLSSTIPLQSLSSPSHTSADAWAFWLQRIAPLVQLVVPAAQTPVLPVLQASPPPGLPSSTVPLQLSSSPLHTSAVACTFWLQAMAPAVQAVVPAAHTPGLPVEQA